MRRHDKKVFFLAPERGSSREEDTCGSACFLHAGIPAAAQALEAVGASSGSDMIYGVRLALAHGSRF